MMSGAREHFEEVREKDRAQKERHRKMETPHLEALNKEHPYRVHFFTMYHARVYGPHYTHAIDVWPSSRKWHDLHTDHRGQLGPNDGTLATFAKARLEQRPVNKANPTGNPLAIVWRLWNLKAGTYASAEGHPEFNACLREKLARVSKADARVRDVARLALVPVQEGDSEGISSKQARWNERFPQWAQSPQLAP